MGNSGYWRASMLSAALLALSGCAGPLLAPSADQGMYRSAPGPDAVQVSLPLTDEPRLEAPPSPQVPLLRQAGEWVNLADRGTAAEEFPDRTAVFWDRLGRDIDLSLEDYRNYYTLGNLTALGLGIGLVAPLANTSADEHIRHWYQRRIRGETTDEYAQVINYAGQGWVVLPLGLEAAALLGRTDAEYVFDSGWYEWSNRSLRAIVVGSPPMLALYAILGSGRPDRNDSHWHPFNDTHGVSGHTFFGAVPFLTAAEMTDDPLLKGTLLAGSFLTGWSRIDLDRHYFSQVALGWWMAYLAVRRVDETQSAARRALILTPGTSEGPGIGVEFRY